MKGHAELSNVLRTDTVIEEVAYRMFARNVGDYADPAMIELAWVDPNIRGFWVEQADAVAEDLARSAAAANHAQQAPTDDQVPLEDSDDSCLT